MRTEKSMKGSFKTIILKGKAELLMRMDITKEISNRGSEMVMGFIRMKLIKVFTLGYGVMMKRMEQDQ